MARVRGWPSSHGCRGRTREGVCQNLAGEEIAFLDEPYRVHELVGSLAGLGDAPLPGSTTERVTLAGQEGGSQR